MELPVIVEGRYDKSTLSQIIDATIITTDGFSVFNSSEKQSFIKKLAAGGGIILLTDSDGGGTQIRKFLRSILPPDKIFNLYIPEIEGKEKRKSRRSKSGLLGVEGMQRNVLEKLFAPFAKSGNVLNSARGSCAKMITKLDFFCDGLSGGEKSADKRQRLAVHFDLPGQMSANALIEALNILFGYDAYKAAVRELFGQAEK